MAEHSLPAPSQTAYPWRATIRTVFQVVIALATLIPVVVITGGIPATGAVAVVLAACAGITRVMALPAVNELLARFAPWLLAEPLA
ncbi:hypothetical protein D5S18_28085 [Nocardia panacis]|uniref:Uncharacterized protein n=1 Tax=Nocardia panacis TaxID=2340916 RepID=A0A3A4JUB6_9NOCA|nr:hypothetical protein [Nocardia panacis]RJO69765.1 hypothetical protein D5S18_28085 [Nocardia panacis]